MKLEFHQPPACGECTLCCKVLEVKEGFITTSPDGTSVDNPTFLKPKDQWCQHAKSKCGCAIYDSRPGICREFKCLWLQGRVGNGDIAFRPDKIHAVLTPTKDGNNIVIHEDPGYPRAARAALKDYIDRFVARGFHSYVIVVCGAARYFIGDPRKKAELEKK